MGTKLCVTYPLPSIPHNSLWQSSYLSIGIGESDNKSIRYHFFKFFIIIINKLL